MPEDAKRLPSAWVAEGYTAHNDADTDSIFGMSPLMDSFIRENSGGIESRKSSSDKKSSQFLVEHLKAKAEQENSFGPKYFCYDVEDCQRERPKSAPRPVDSTHARLFKNKERIGYYTLAFTPRSRKKANKVDKPVKDDPVGRKLFSSGAKQRPASAFPSRRPISSRVAVQRPASAYPANPPRPVVYSSPHKSTPQSARKVLDKNSNYVLIDREYEEKNFRLETYASACPDVQYMSRHARCFDQNHMHHQPLHSDRPNKVCGCGNCGVLTLAGPQVFKADRSKRAASAPIVKSHTDRLNLNYSPYMESMRPWSAPSQRTKSSLPQYNKINRGTIPHFCNFVKRMKLNSKTETKTPAEEEPPELETDQQQLNKQYLDVDQTSRMANLTSSRGTNDSSRDRKVSLASWEDEASEDDQLYPSGLQQIDPDVIEHREVEEPGIPLQEQPAVIEADSPAPESAEASPLLPSNEGEDTNSINEEQLTGNDSEDLLSKLKTDLEDNRDSQSQDKSNNNQQVNLANENNNQLDDNEPDETSITIQQATVEAVSSLTQPAVDVPPLPKVQFDTEPQPPTQTSTQPSNQRRRSSLQKKERKSVERSRQQKPKEAEMEEVAVKEGPQEEVKESEPVPETPPPPPEAPLDVTVPDLPSQESERTKRHRDLRAKKTRRESLKFSVLDNANVHQDILEDMKEQGQFYDFSTMTEAAKEEYRKQRIKPLSWMQARLAFSQQSSRFELPIDMKLLETMSGVDYLKKYCIISHRRRALYQKIHAKYRGTQTSIDVQDLKRALQDVLFNTVTTSEIQDMCDIVGIERNAEIDFKLFAGIAAMAERMLYPKFLTDDTSEMKEYKKEMVELADFSALNWKLHNVKVNPEVRTIFRTLCC